MDRDKLIENLMTSLPSMFRRLMKGFPISEISRISKQQLELLFRLSQEDGKPMSYYSDQMMVPKSNLTVMADKLIEEGVIERAFDRNDRRVVILKITKKGEEHLTKHKEIVKQFMMKKLDLLNDDDLTRLCAIAEEMTAIFDRIK